MKELNLANCLFGILLSLMFAIFVCVVNFAYNPIHSEMHSGVVSAFNC